MTQIKNMDVMNRFYRKGYGARKIAADLNIARGTVSAWIYGERIADWFSEFQSSWQVAD